VQSNDIIVDEYVSLIEVELELEVRLDQLDQLHQLVFSLTEYLNSRRVGTLPMFCTDHIWKTVVDEHPNGLCNI